MACGLIDCFPRITHKFFSISSMLNIRIANIPVILLRMDPTKD